MNKKSYKVSIIGASLIAASLLFSATALAVTLPDQANNPPQQGGSNSQREIAKTRLQDAKLRACQAREKGIKNRSSRLASLSENMQGKFDAIAQRVQDYYTNTVVPSGKTVANYDALVLDIQAKKTVVQNALGEAQNDIDDFSCTSDNPKDIMMHFREDMQEVKQALKDYRASIKNLIVAVRSITGEENNNQ